MLCHICHIHVRRDFPYCLHCGALRRGVTPAGFAPPTLTVHGRTLTLSAEVTTIGRGSDNDIVIDEPSVSRRHARITRTAAGYAIEDLGSANGTSVGDDHLQLAATTLPDHTPLHIGDVPATFAQPRPIAVGGRTVMHEDAPDDEPEAPAATEPLSARPRPYGSWALKRIPDDGGVERWVLRNTRNGRYLELDARDVFIWQHLDGETAIRDLLYAYAQQYGELALPRIERTLRSLAAIDLIRGLPGQDAAPSSPLRRAGRALLHALLRLEVTISGLDRIVGRIYRRGGWRLFSRPAVALLWLVIVAGLAGFWVARGRQRLFDVGGSGVWGLVVFAAIYLAALTLHELTHALAVKSYARRLTRGGFMLMMGMPFAFVDTSDMWFGSRWSRIVVTMSGPLSTAGIAGIAALVAAYAGGAVAGVAFQVAFALYLNTLYNLNPLLPLDGYQALADALRVPKLREEAMAYARRGLWRDLRARQRPGLRQVGMACYGLGALIATYLFLVLAVLAWRTRLGGLVHRLPAPWGSVAIVAVIAIVMFPVWWRLVHSVRTLIRGAVA